MLPTTSAHITENIMAMVMPSLYLTQIRHYDSKKQTQHNLITQQLENRLPRTRMRISCLRTHGIEIVRSTYRISAFPEAPATWSSWRAATSAWWTAGRTRAASGTSPARAASSRAWASSSPRSSIVRATSSGSEAAPLSGPPWSHSHHANDVSIARRFVPGGTGFAQARTSTAGFKRERFAANNFESFPRSSRGRSPPGTDRVRLESAGAELIGYLDVFGEFTIRLDLIVRLGF